MDHVQNMNENVDGFKQFVELWLMLKIIQLEMIGFQTQFSQSSMCIVCRSSNGMEINWNFFVLCSRQL